jgi:hypothetical protein
MHRLPTARLKRLLSLTRSPHYLVRMVYRQFLCNNDSLGAFCNLRSSLNLRITAELFISQRLRIYIYVRKENRGFLLEGEGMRAVSIVGRATLSLLLRL